MKIGIEVSAATLADMMTSAIEHNPMTRAWCGGVYLESHGGGEAYKGGDGWWYADPALFEPGSGIRLRVVELTDESEGDGAPQDRIVTEENIANGLALMAREHARQFGDLLNGDGDNITADVFLQCIALGEFRYG